MKAFYWERIFRGVFFILFFLTVIFVLISSFKRNLNRSKISLVHSLSSYFEIRSATYPTQENQGAMNFVKT